MAVAKAKNGAATRLRQVGTDVVRERQALHEPRVGLITTVNKNKRKAAFLRQLGIKRKYFIVYLN